MASTIKIKLKIKSAVTPGTYGGEITIKKDNGAHGEFPFLLTDLLSCAPGVVKENQKPFALTIYRKNYQGTDQTVFLAINSDHLARPESCSLSEEQRALLLVLGDILWEGIQKIQCQNEQWLNRAHWPVMDPYFNFLAGLGIPFEPRRIIRAKRLLEIPDDHRINFLLSKFLFG